jgi:hypothetical protein
MVRILAFVVLVFSFSVPALASDWSNSLGGKTLGQIVVRTHMRMAVVGRGEGTQALAAELLERLADVPGIESMVKACPRLAPSHSDLQALALCARAGANYVLVVRLAPSDPGAAVLTLYDRNGERIAQVSVKQGAAPDPEEGNEELSEGAGSSSLLPGDPKALRQWKRKRLSISKEASDGSSLQDGVIQRGQWGDIVWALEFYRLMGKRGLVKSYKRYWYTRAGLVTVSFVGGLMSSVYMVGALFDPEEACEGVCEGNERWSMFGKAFGGVALSGGALWLLNSWHHRSLDMGTISEMVETYNLTLRRKIGLPPLESDLQAPAEPTMKMVFLPYVLPEGGGVALALTW